MNTEKIRAQWASLSMAEDGRIIVCAGSNGSPHCILFDSLEQLKSAVENKIISAKKWALAVPRNVCILKSISLPASDMDEAARMIEFEVPSLVPLPPDEFVYGCTPLNKQENVLNILVCILKLDILNNYIESLKDIGITPYRITLDALAIQNWFNQNGKVDSGQLSSVLINRRKGIIQAGVDGNLNAASDFILAEKDEESVLKELAEEILRQRDELPADAEESIRFFITDSEKYIPGLKSFLISEMQVAEERISVVPYPDLNCYNGDISCMRDDYNYNIEAVISSGLLELVENSRYPQSNLLPREYIKKHEQKLLLYKYLYTAGLAVTMLVLLWLYLVASNWRIERKINRIEAQIAPIEKVAGGVDSKRQRVIAIRRQLSNRGQISRILDELYQYTPKAITISELKYEAAFNGASVEIKGQADSMPAAFDYTDAVSKAQLLHGIQVENVQQISRPGGSIVIFKAYCDIRNEGFYDDRDNE